jgi:glucodextranase-like protein
VLPNPLRRAAMLAGTLSLLALAGPIASASAEVGASQITSPAGPTYALYNETLTPPQHAFTVTGTTTGTGNVALRCYYGPGPKEYRTLVKKVEPSGGAFSVEVEAKELYFAPCVLRAVPFEVEEAHPPGTPAEEAKDPFQGPRIVGSRFELFPEDKTPSDYEFEANSLSGDFQIESVGDCGLDYSNLYAQDSLTPSEHLFDCNAYLAQSNSPPSEKPTPTRSELQIDGANAYSPAAAGYVNEAIQKELESKKEPLKPIPGAPQVTVSQVFEPLTGLVKITEVDPTVKCSPSTAFPPTSTSCTSFVSTGVQLERTWQTSNADQVATMTDTWRSTNGAAHSLNALYNQTTVNGGKAGGAYQFPGTNVFSATTRGESVTLPPGLGRIFYKQDGETPGEGDGKHPQGAIVYDTPPSGPLSVYQGTAVAGYNGFEMPYQATIPAGGSYTLNMAFVQAYKLSEVEALSSEVLAKFPASPGPTLSIASPTSGTTVSTPNVTASGSVSDTRAITSLTVDGQPVSVGTNGAWSTSVPLAEGANTIKALATDQAGLSTEKTVSVTYKPIPPVAHARQVGSANGANGEVTFTLECTGSAGTSCEVEAALATFEKTRNGRAVAVLARRHHSKTRSEEVSVGSSKVTFQVGQRVTIAVQLGAAGKSLLARFGVLPVHLTVVQLSAGHRSTVIAQNLTVRPHRARHHHRHHHHRR